MIIDGRELAAAVIADIRASIATLSEPPRLAVFTCEPNFETQKFLALKERQAKAAGITLERITVPATITLPELEMMLQTTTTTADGIIIQLPFPHLDTADLISLIPASHDVDAFLYQGSTEGLLPPVVGAIDHISSVYSVEWAGKQVVIVGNGRLVGAPMLQYATTKGGNVTLVTKEHPDLSPLLLADIVVLGAGVPALVLPEHVKEGVVVFDAGTSEEGGMLVGDADAAVAKKASLFTPVPGGIGPLTVAMLLKNVLYCAKSQ